MLSFMLFIISGLEYSLERHMGVKGLILVIDCKCCMTAPPMLVNMCDAAT